MRSSVARLDRDRLPGIRGEYGQGYRKITLVSRVSEGLHI
ncbi:hypothetical protein P3T29_006371 [Kitasatospora sp. MAP5-34]|nr:hypothetical protein [Kitasatospora sp. MAP5-34]